MEDQSPLAEEVTVDGEWAPDYTGMSGVVPNLVGMGLGCFVLHRLLRHGACVGEWESWDLGGAK